MQASYKIEPQENGTVDVTLFLRGITPYENLVSDLRKHLLSFDISANHAIDADSLDICTKKEEETI